MSIYFLFLCGFVYILLFYFFTVPSRLKRGSLKEFLKVRFLKIGGVFETVAVIAQLINPRLFLFSNETMMVLQITGGALFITGLGLVTWAKLTMGQNWALPGKVKENQKKLITSGPFTFSRNPIYVGRIILLLGFELGLHSWLVFILIPDILATYFIVRDEEESLIKKFGQSYKDYMKKVPRYF
jgi:protein-S-isoprenylcysteine O-methyltransferase Ste14